ncbi:hypothetical protein ACC703_39640, partial [Rhizobium ruizarguesonis]
FANSVGVNVCVPIVTTAEAIGNTLCTFLEENPGIREATCDELMTTLIANSMKPSITLPTMASLPNRR